MYMIGVTDHKIKEADEPEESKLYELFAFGHTHTVWRLMTTCRDRKHKLKMLTHGFGSGNTALDEAVAGGFSDLVWVLLEVRVLSVQNVHNLSVVLWEP